jgi:hypothetical protein
MPANQPERRKAQRVEADLKLEVKFPVKDGQLEIANLEALNISSSGVYFRSDHFIEPMTKLAMVFELPQPRADAEQDPAWVTVQCEGIVVRTSPERESPACEQYEVAVFFTGIDSEGLRNLEEHIAAKLSAV